MAAFPSSFAMKTCSLQFLALDKEPGPDQEKGKCETRWEYSSGALRLYGSGLREYWSWRSPVIDGYHPVLVLLAWQTCFLHAYYLWQINCAITSAGLAHRRETRTLTVLHRISVYCPLNHCQTTNHQPKLVAYQYVMSSIILVSSVAAIHTKLDRYFKIYLSINLVKGFSFLFSPAITIVITGTGQHQLNIILFLFPRNVHHQIIGCSVRTFLA